MSEQTLLVETSAGPLGAIVTEPEGSPIASAILLHGGGTSGRPGNNRVFARIARAVADIGVVVLRADYPGQGSSPGRRDLGARKGDTPGDIEAVLDLSAWFRERTGDLDRFVIGSCYGARLGSRLAAQQERLAGLALVAPAIQVLAPEKPRSRGGRGRRGFRRLRRTLRSGRRREETPRSVDALTVDRRVAATIEATLGRAPTWVLAGELDVFARLLPEVRKSLGTNGQRLELDLVPDMVFHAYPTAEAQRLAIERVAAWTRRRIEELRGAQRA